MKLLIVLALMSMIVGLPGLTVNAAFMETMPSMVVSSDASWKSARTAPVGWEKLDFDDSTWKNAASPSIGTCQLGREKPSFTTPMWYTPAAERQTVHFRKTFMLPNQPEAARMKVAFDDDGEVYINGVKVVTDASGKTESVAIEKDVTEFLHKGENVVAMKVFDTRGGCQWAQVLFNLYITDALQVNIPHFMQTDTMWAQDQYAGGAADSLSCGSTIADCGCLTTSLAMTLRGYNIHKLATGDEITPKTLNSYMKENQKCSGMGCVSKGYVYGAVRWSAVHELSQQSHEMHSAQKIQFIGFKDFTTDFMVSQLEDEQPVIAKSPLTSHWFVIFGAQENTFNISDPLHSVGLLTDRYQNTAARLADFRRVNSDFSQIEVYAKAPHHVTITDMVGHIAGFRSPSETREAIPNSSYAFESHPEADSEGVNVLIVNQPAQGSYIVETTAPEVAMYLAEQSGKETYDTYTSPRAVIHYDPTSVENSSVTETALLACSVDMFNTPVTLHGRNLQGTPVVLQGEIRVENQPYGAE